MFFGEDVFLAFGAVLLIQGFYKGQGIELDPLSIGLWALPTAASAFVIHAVRIVIFERRIARTRPTPPGAALPEARLVGKPPASPSSSPSSGEAG